MPISQHNQNGITLIEALIVLAMLAILTAVLTPSMNTYFNQGNVKGATEALYGDVNLARTIATKSTNTVTITFVSGASWCYGLSSGAIACACNSAPSGTNCDLGITTAASFKNTTLAVTNATMTFSTSRGTTTGNTAVFSATNPSQSATVTINDMGTPSICSTSASVGGYPAC
jgi:Tfp pilus assembly protein FimT